MKTRTMEIWLGLFVLTGMLVVVGLVVLFGEVLNFSRQTYVVKAHFQKVTGLKPGTPVRMLGIDIGKLRELHFRTNCEGVELVLAIDERYDIPADAKLSVLTEGLLGDNYLEFGAGSAEAVPHDGTAIVSGQAYLSPQEFLVEAVEDFKGTAATYEELAVNLNKRLADDELFDNVKKTTEEIPKALQSFRETSDKLASLADKLNIDAEAISDGLKQLTTTVEGQVTHQGENLDKLAEGLQGSIDGLNKTLDSLHQVTETVRKGEGTVGGLMMKDEIYKEMLTTFEQTQKTLEELGETVKFIREHPDAFVWGK